VRNTAPQPVFNTAMGIAVTDSLGWSVDAGLPTSRGFKRFECAAPPGSGRNLSDTTVHWFPSGLPEDEFGNSLEGGKMDFSCDGFKTWGGAEQYHTCINWSSKANYDPVKRRVLWMTKGTGSGHHEYNFNTLAIYRLGIDEQEGWHAIRGFQATTPYDVGDPTGLPLTHYFGNNCIDVVGRRMYKKQFQTKNSTGVPGYSGPFHVFNLDSDIYQPNDIAKVNCFEPSMLAPADDPYAAGMGPMDFIPTRGSRGTLWYSNASGNPRIYEYDVATGTGSRADWVVIAPGGLMPDIPSNFRAADSMGLMVYQKRAFGGAGGVIIFGGSGYGGKPATTYMWTVGTHGSKLPYGDPNGPQVYRIDGAHLPFTLGGGINGGEGHVVPHPDPAFDGWLLFPMGNSTLPENDVVWYLAGNPSATWQKLLDANGNVYQMPTNAAPMGPTVTIEELGVCWIVGQRPSSGVYTTPRAWLFKPASGDHT
jgi:hypothetical protein